MGSAKPGSRSLPRSSGNHRQKVQVEIHALKRTSAETKESTVVPEPSYNVPIGLLVLSVLGVENGQPIFAAVTGALGLLLAYQAANLKFMFTTKELIIFKRGEEDVSENAIIGGDNNWKFSTFVNWEFWWPNFPILCYFKETQTKPEGQIHFFPIIFNGKQLYDVFVERCGPSQNSGPQ
eukprot:evm.model.scf_887.7 EVM.evm.TU.scf_887.7   scf_887:37136-39197(+)